MNDAIIKAAYIIAMGIIAHGWIIQSSRVDVYAGDAMNKAECLGYNAGRATREFFTGESHD